MRKITMLPLRLLLLSWLKAIRTSPAGSGHVLEIQKQADNRPMSPTEKSYRILVADDQPAVLDALKLLLRSEGFEVDLVRAPQVVLESIALREYDALLLDLNYARDTTSGREGIELLENIRKLDSQVPVIVMTAWGTINLAVDAMRRGARDFVQKPWEDERLLATIRTNAELYRALRQGQRLEAENKLFRAQR